ncbi:MAG: phosphotransferase [Planctomycetes bacterium]|nr:phosphotransferase [Planctomycetota bacterium]
MAITDAPDAALSARACLQSEPARFLRRTQGRETFVWGADQIGKRTIERARGGLWPWFRVRSAGEREHQNLLELSACGVPVPRALAWAEIRRGGERVSVCLMERIEHTATLRDLLAGAPQPARRELARELIEIVIRLHAHGFIHRDLYLQHVLQRSSDGALILIDVGRVRRARRWRTRWYVKDLASLLHSTPANVTVRERLEFLARWLTARGIVARGARRRWLRAIVRKARRIATHVPRDERASVGAAAP